MEIVFYNRNGRPIAYTEDWATIYLYTGDPVAYLIDGAVYAFTGTHLGWFVEGRILDQAGRDLFITNLAMGRPATPLKLAPLGKGAKRTRPLRRLKEPEAAQPLRVRVWAARSSERFFRPIETPCSRGDIRAYVLFQPSGLYPRRKSAEAVLAA